MNARFFTETGVHFFQNFSGFSKQS